MYVSTVVGEKLLMHKNFILFNIVLFEGLQTFSNIYHCKVSISKNEIKI